jgi:pectate lyase
MIFFKIMLVALLMAPMITEVKAQPLAFPGAEGCGRFTTGGRGGKVVFVTNLNDSGKGSFRDALIHSNYPRIIIFSVSGTIFLKSIIEVTEGNFTIAGQSSPGAGICVGGAGIDIVADNVIIRYMRFRPGDIDSIETDALTIRRSRNIIIDHCSMSWSTDETCSCYDNTNFTLQWCILSESLNKSVHHKGEHGYGGIWGGINATFHHNLLAHHKSRNPRLNGSRYHKKPESEKAELINNVIYNWKSKCIYGGEEGEYTIAGNYFKAGPATEESSSDRILEPWQPFGSCYFNNNFVEGDSLVSADNKKAVFNNYALPPDFFCSQPLSVSNLIPEPATDAYFSVLEQAGASLERDQVDIRIVDDVRERKYTFGKKGIINCQNEAGGWPELKRKTPKPDSDQDGMPDEWEIKNNLNPGSNNSSIIKPGQNYSNIELYLNSLCIKQVKN